jgi:hypothetical protein
MAKEEAAQRVLKGMCKRCRAKAAEEDFSDMKKESKKRKGKKKVSLPDLGSLKLSDEDDESYEDEE